MNDIERYFEAVGFQPDDLISLGARAGADGQIFFTIIPVSDAPRQIQARNSRNVWISANPIRQPAPREDGKPTRGSAEDVTRMDALWADIDVGEGKMPTIEAAWDLVRNVSEALNCDPNVVVLTGHGLQPRWRLEDSYLDPNEGDATLLLSSFGRLVKWYAAQLGGDVDNVYDLARILRAPGTMNLKPDLDPVAVKVQWGGDDVVAREWLEDLVAPYEPKPEEMQPVLPKEENVDLSRGDKYTDRVVSYVSTELIDAHGWAADYTDEKDRGWEKLCADAAYRLAELAKADWNSLDPEEARTIFLGSAPTDSSWTRTDLEKKWESQWSRAEAAEPPAIKETQSHDPLADNFVAPDPAGAPGGAGEAPAAVPGVPGWRKYSWDDQGNAERIIARYGDILRWSPQLDRWLTYESGVWSETKVGGQHFAAKLFDELPRLEADLYSDEEYEKSRGNVTSERLEFLKFWAKQRFSAKHKAAADTIKNLGRLDAAPADFDQQPMLLNVTNGVIDLRDGELLAHDPEFMMRQQAPVAYDAEAKATEWEAFIEHAFPDPAIRAYLQRVVGYTLSGHTGEQAIFVHFGPPATGKSVFLRIIEAVFGNSLARPLPSDLLLTKRFEQHPTGIAGLEGRRILHVSETPEGARLDEALVKRLTGEETITARGMNQDFRDFRLVGKLHMVTNHKPHLSDDTAVHRRLHPIPWNVTVPPEQRDIFLANRIIENELPGVLRWALEGAIDWQRNRLSRPLSLEMELVAWVEDEDEFGTWIRENVINTGENGFATPSKDLYRSYRQWTEARGGRPMHETTFSKKLGSRGFEQFRKNAFRGFRAALTQPDPLSR